MILILGASGYIGSHLYNRLREDSLDVLGTYFRNGSAGKVYFDLENMSIDDIGINSNDLDFIIFSAAANTRIDDSKIHWQYSYKTNVIRTKEIIDYCHQNNIVPIYLSTDNVFDGKKGNYSELDERNPVNCYGQMRYEVENYLLGSSEPFVILRMGKVFGTDIEDGTLIVSMIKTLKEEKKIFCADDQVSTPLYIENLVKFIKTLIENRIIGIFHLASTKPITRYEIALDVQKYYALQKSDVCPCKINSFGLIERRPVLIDLNISKYKEITGFKEMEISHFLGMIK